MSTTAPSKPLLTPADLLAMPDGADYELDAGVLVERNVSRLSSLVAQRIGRFLGNHCEPIGLAWVFNAELGYCCFPGRPDTMRKPDVSLVLCERLPAEDLEAGVSEIAPDLAVEVISPNDMAYKVEAKIEEYLGAGVRLVWVVYPEIRTVYVHRPGGPTTRLGPDAELTGEDVIRGFRCRVGDLFPPVKTAGA